MATVTKIETPSGPRWEYRGRLNGKATDRRFKTSREAHDFMAKTEHDRRAHGFYVDRKAGRITFGDMAERWFASRNLKATSARSTRSDLRNHILPALGDKALADITELDLEAFLANLRDTRRGGKLTAGSRARIWRRVHSIFAAAVADRRISAEADPTANMTVRAPERAGAITELEPEQVHAILASIHPRYRAAVMLAAGAGLRISEVLGLTKSRVRFMAREQEVVVERQLTNEARMAPTLTLPKSGHGRSVPVPGSVLAPLAEYLAANRRGTVTDEVDGTTVDDLIFATGLGNPIDRGYLLRRFKTAARRAGIPGARFHDLRHFYAAALIDRGLSEREVGLRLGHSSTEVTRIYGHLFDRSADRTRHAIYDVLTPPTEKSYPPAAEVVAIRA